MRVVADMVNSWTVCWSRVLAVQRSNVLWTKMKYALVCTDKIDGHSMRLAAVVTFGTPDLVIKSINYKYKEFQQCLQILLMILSSKATVKYW